MAAYRQYPFLENEAAILPSVSNLPAFASEMPLICSKPRFGLSVVSVAG